MIFEEDFCGGNRSGGFTERAVESRMLAANRSLRLALVVSSRDKPLHE